MGSNDALAAAKEARDAVDAAEDELVAVRETYHVTIRQLAADGMSLRDIAQALGMSHQRVHQIVAGATTVRRRSGRGRGAGVAAGALIAVLLLASVALLGNWQQNGGEPRLDRPQESATEESSESPEARPWPDTHPDAPWRDDTPRCLPTPGVPPSADCERPWNEDTPPCPGGLDVPPDALCEPPSVVPLA